MRWPGYLTSSFIRAQAHAQLLTTGKKKKTARGAPLKHVSNQKNTKSSSGVTFWTIAGIFPMEMSPNFQICRQTPWKLYPLSDPFVVDSSLSDLNTCNHCWKFLSRARNVNTRFFEHLPFLRSSDFMMSSHTLSKGDQVGFIFVKGKWENIARKDTKKCALWKPKSLKFYAHFNLNRKPVLFQY